MENPYGKPVWKTVGAGWHYFDYVPISAFPIPPVVCLKPYVISVRRTSESYVFCQPYVYTMCFSVSPTYVKNIPFLTVPAVYRNTE